MPELPEVEITRRGIAPHLAGRIIQAVTVREPRLRWPVPAAVSGLAGRMIRSVKRRGKYILIDCGDGHLIIHLGMSGSLRILAPGAAPAKHDHFELQADDRLLRLRDPRRLGAVLWAEGDANAHPLIAGLGIEPLSRAFDAHRLYALTRGRRVAIKPFLMDARKIVGVGNIYANESLFSARINPHASAGRLSMARCVRLVAAVKDTLRAAIRAGGSSLRDFVRSDGRPGCFQQDYRVYNRGGEPCRRCGAPIRRVRIGQRSTFYCAACQK